MSEVKDPDYVEGTGMKFKVVRWKGRPDVKGKGRGGTASSSASISSTNTVVLSDREMEVEMLKIAKRKRKGLLIFADEATVAGEGVRVSNYVSSSSALISESTCPICWEMWAVGFYCNLVDFPSAILIPCVI